MDARTEIAARDDHPERKLARTLANKILERPFGDPDDDLALLSREFLRLDERMNGGTELEQATKRWVYAKRQQMLRHDLRGDLEHEVKRQERDVEDAIYEELQAATGSEQRNAHDR